MEAHQNQANKVTNIIDRNLFFSRDSIKQFTNIFWSDFIGAAIYSSDEDESDFETRRKKKPDRTKALRDSDEESDGSEKKATSGNDSNAKTGSDSDSD